MSQIVAAGPEAYGLDTEVWDVKQVRKVIREKFGISRSNSQVNRILHQLGFTVQYPNRRLSRVDETVQQRWIKETFEPVKKSRTRRRCDPGRRRSGVPAIRHNPENLGEERDRDDNRQYALQTIGVGLRLYQS